MYPYLLLSVSPYPNSALSAWQLAIIAVVPVLTLAAGPGQRVQHPVDRRQAGALTPVMVRIPVSVRWRCPLVPGSGGHQSGGVRAAVR